MLELHAKSERVYIYVRKHVDIAKSFQLCTEIEVLETVIVMATNKRILSMVQVKLCMKSIGRWPKMEAGLLKKSGILYLMMKLKKLNKYMYICLSIMQNSGITSTVERTLIMKETCCLAN